MTPGPLTYWLEQLVIIMVLLALSLLLPLLPARHFIAHYWPVAVDELIIVGENGPERLLVPAREVEIDWSLVARSRPSSVVTIETTTGELVHGFPIGVRQLEDSGLVFASRIDLSAIPGHLVMQLADESHLEINQESIRRAFHANQMNLSQRVRLTILRMSEAWRVGRSERADFVDGVMTKQAHEQTIDPQGNAGAVR
ncbi:MAG: hypothetical protein EA370_08640 [Wenzhouxiangella sp.]|nr:MAG: hypothetical protein EA370_08640 [Wenzhouxiangella sp.]